ncbi:DUF2589 domain-containing protein [Bradyrhizobium oligotrophicum]|uniref:DUF2589 domain-containing protein n=1 Tax=Bradyrhizobium oligotrophicum TaxID=44255 RepID=UPI003EBD00A3
MGYAIENVTSLPFRNLIGGPLVAAVEAQAMAAKSTMDFIMEVGFSGPTDDITDPAKQPDIGNVRNVTFKYSADIAKADGTGTEKKDFSLTVPLLTIVPIPNLAIEEMTIDFMAKITESISYDRSASQENAKNATLQAKGGWGPVSSSFKGSLSSKHSSTASSSSKYNTELTMNIRVRATQDDMPAGLMKILDILAGIVKASTVTPTQPPRITPT